GPIGPQRPPMSGIPGATPAAAQSIQGSSGQAPSGAARLLQSPESGPAISSPQGSAQGSADAQPLSTGIPPGSYPLTLPPGSLMPRPSPAYWPQQTSLPESAIQPA